MLLQTYQAFLCYLICEPQYNAAPVVGAGQQRLAGTPALFDAALEVGHGNLGLMHVASTSSTSRTISSSMPVFIVTTGQSIG